MEVRGWEASSDMPGEWMPSLCNAQCLIRRHRQWRLKQQDAKSIVPEAENVGK